MKKNNKKGFTLVELLVVIAILAILASVAVVGYTAFVKRAEESNAKTELHQIVATINADLIDDGKWEFTVTDDSGVRTTYTVERDGDTFKASSKVDQTVTAMDVEDVIELCPDFAGLFADEETIELDGKTLTYKVGEVSVEEDLK